MTSVTSVSSVTSFRSVVGGLLAAMVVLAIGARCRRAEDRVVALVRVSRQRHRPSGAPSIRQAGQSWMIRVPVVTGRALRRLGGQGGDPVADLRLGRAVLAAAFAAPVTVALAPLAGAALWWAPPLVQRRDARRRHHRLIDQLPDLVDLVAVAVGAGCNIALALDAAVPALHGDLAEAFGQARRRTADGLRLADALDSLRTDDVLRPFIDVLIDAERYGAPLAPSLERVAAEARARRRRHAEETARRLPVLLLFPLVLCVLPAFALLTVIPLLAGSLLSLHL